MDIQVTLSSERLRTDDVGHDECLSALEGVPIVVVTRQSRESGTQFGWPVAEYFEKPVPMARLAEALRNCAKHPDVSVA